MSGTTTQALEELLRRDISVASHMGVTVNDCDTCSVTLSAPLSANENHKGTGFGGSIYALAVMSGWLLVTHKLLETDLPAEVVIYEGRIGYVRPVTADFSATARIEPTALEQCVARLQRRTMARLRLEIPVYCQGIECARFSGDFVIQK